MTLKTYISVLITVFFLACNTQVDEGKKILFNKHGISFTCPKDWKVTDEDYSEDGYYSLSIERRGFDESGIVNVVWFDYEIDLLESVETLKEGMTEETIYKYSDLEMEKMSKLSYNGQETLGFKYKASIIGVKHTGVIHTFNKDGKTVWLIVQEATEDSKKNKSGFKTIEDSFQVVDSSVSETETTP